MMLAVQVNGTKEDIASQGGCRCGTHIYRHRSEILLCIIRMRRTGLRPVAYASGRRRRITHRQNHLPGGVAIVEGLRTARPCACSRVREKLRQINAERQLRAPGRRFHGKSYYADEVEADPSLAVDVYIAKPRMSHYLNASGKDIRHLPAVRLRRRHPRILHRRGCSWTSHGTCTPPTAKAPHELARDIVRAIYNETGITATAGIGTNLYLAKVAMDIVAKHIPADTEGVRIA